MTQGVQRLPAALADSGSSAQSCRTWNGYRNLPGKGCEGCAPAEVPSASRGLRAKSEARHQKSHRPTSPMTLRSSERRQWLLLLGTCHASGLWSPAGFDARPACKKPNLCTPLQAILAGGIASAKAARFDKEPLATAAWHGSCVLICWQAGSGLR